MFVLEAASRHEVCPLDGPDEVVGEGVAELGVELAPEREYEWFISLVPSPDNKSKDIVSGASIIRVAGAIPSAPRSPQDYAERGLWYDALESLMDALDEQPGSQAIAAERDSLLRQGGLGAATP